MAVCRILPSGVFVSAIPCVCRQRLLGGTGGRRLVVAVTLPSLSVDVSRVRGSGIECERGVVPSIPSLLGSRTHLYRRTCVRLMWDGVSVS